jgi:hypothetical protein
MQKPYPRFPHLTPKEAQELTESSINVDIRIVLALNPYTKIRCCGCSKNIKIVNKPINHTFGMQKPYPRFPHLTPKEAQELTESSINVDILAAIRVVAILGFSPIYLKAGYAFGFSFPSGLIFVIVWSAPTRTSELLISGFHSITSGSLDKLLKV